MLKDSHYENITECGYLSEAFLSEASVQICSGCPACFFIFFKSLWKIYAPHLLNFYRRKRLQDGSFSLIIIFYFEHLIDLPLEQTLQL